jgi:hypothetical protein
MTETIGVTYLSVLGGTAYHMALFYENSAGVRTIIEAAPQIDMGQVPITTQIGEVTKEAFSSENTNDGSPYGYIVGGVRSWSTLPPFLDDQRPSETLLTGDNLQATWNQLVTAANNAFAQHYEYRDAGHRREPIDSPFLGFSPNRLAILWNRLAPNWSRQSRRAFGKIVMSL